MGVSEHPEYMRIYLSTFETFFLDGFLEKGAA